MLLVAVVCCALLGSASGRGVIVANHSTGVACVEYPPPPPVPPRVCMSIHAFCKWWVTLNLGTKAWCLPIDVNVSLSHEPQNTDSNARRSTAYLQGGGSPEARTRFLVERFRPSFERVPSARIRFSVQFRGLHSFTSQLECLLWDRGCA